MRRNQLAIRCMSDKKQRPLNDPLVMMSPFRMRSSIAAALREAIEREKVSMAYFIAQAIQERLERLGDIESDDEMNLRRLEALKKEREAREAAAAEQKAKDAEKILIEHLVHWRKHGKGVPYPYFAGRPCPPGFEDVARGTIQPEEEI